MHGMALQSFGHEYFTAEKDSQIRKNKKHHSLWVEHCEIKSMNEPGERDRLFATDSRTDHAWLFI